MSCQAQLYVIASEQHSLRRKSKEVGELKHPPQVFRPLEFFELPISFLDPHNF